MMRGTSLLALATLAALTVTALSPSVRSPSLELPSQAADEIDKVNLNTASAEELARLPRLGRDSVSAIVEKRKAAPFRDWNDFVARRLVPSFSLKAIRYRVTF
jgi:DNA uptake protein ComE-like DNA-binding protein